MPTIFDGIWLELEDHHEGMRDSAIHTIEGKCAARNEFLAWLEVYVEKSNPQAMLHKKDNGTRSNDYFAEAEQSGVTIGKQALV